MRCLQVEAGAMHTSFKGVLFDFDGVIADTERHNADYLAAALAVHGVMLSAAERLALVGLNTRSMLENLTARASDGLTVEQLQAERRARGNYYEDGKELAPMPGAVMLLQRLRRAGVKIGLVSSTRTQLIIAALNRMKLTDRFDVIVCGDMVEHHKPAPDGYRKALSLLELCAEECIVVEDSPVGIRAAQSAGLAVIAYKGGEIRQDTAQAEYSAASFEECTALLFGGARDLV